MNLLCSSDLLLQYALQSLRPTGTQVVLFPIMKLYPLKILMPQLKPIPKILPSTSPLSAQPMDSFLQTSYKVTDKQWRLII